MKKILLFLLLALITSCGSARMVDTKKEEVKVNIEIKTDSIKKTTSEKNKVESSNIKTESTIKKDDRDEVVIKETTYEPSDNSKPSIIIDEDGKRTTLENVKKTTKETTQKKNTKTENVSKKDEVVNITTKEKENGESSVSVISKDNTTKDSKSKQSETEPFNMLKLLWLLVPIGIGLILYYFYRKYKQLTSII